MGTNEEIHHHFVLVTMAKNTTQFSDMKKNGCEGDYNSDRLAVKET